MLILAMAKNERIVIGEDIMIQVLDIHAVRVRIGISAPDDTSIHREELREAMRRDAMLPRSLD